MSKTDHATAAERQPSMLEPFEAWASSQRAQGELSAASVAKYQSLWKAWLGWVSAQSLKWDGVTAADIERFLQGPAPGQGGRRRAINAQRMSSYTVQRYWRLLLGVYAAAAREKHIPNNPVLDVPDELRPSVSGRDRQSQVLEPAVFSRLRQPRTLVSLLKTQSEEDWWHIRDRAMMAVLVEAGLTVSELIALRGMDIREIDTMAPPVDRQPSLIAPTGEGLRVDVMATQDTIGRTLDLSPGMTVLVREWLDFRARLLLERSARTATLAQRSEFLRKHATQGPLFVARRSRASTEVLPEMDPVTVYYAVSQALKKLRAELTMLSTGADKPYVAKGPAVIRNSVIRLWLDQLGVEETVRRAGLKNADSLRLKANSEVKIK